MSRADDATNYGGIATIIVIVGVMVFSVMESITKVRRGGDRLDVVVAAEVDTTQALLLRGRILCDGIPADSAMVWAVVTDSRGSRYSPPSAITKTDGAFAIRFDFHGLLSGATVDSSRFRDARVQVCAHVTDRQTSQRLQGESLLVLGDVPVRWIKLPIAANLSVISIFVASIILALLQAKEDSFFLKLRYYMSVALAFIFTFAMIAYISLGLHFINATAARDEVISLGYANLHFGTYVNGVEEEWLLSLTAPTREGLARGFGVPLWIVLLSVLGTGVYTISIIVANIKEKVNFSNVHEVRVRIDDIVRHQFYILFSPLCAAIVYQILVAAGAATEHVTVALATLAAGVALSVILDRAVDTVQSILSAGDGSQDGSTTSKTNTTGSTQTATN